MKGFQDHSPSISLTVLGTLCFVTLVMCQTRFKISKEMSQDFHPPVLRTKDSWFLYSIGNPDRFKCVLKAFIVITSPVISIISTGFLLLGKIKSNPYFFIPWLFVTIKGLVLIQINNLITIIRDMGSRKNFIFGFRFEDLKWLIFYSSIFMIDCKACEYYYFCTKSYHQYYYSDYTDEVIFASNLTRYFCFFSTISWCHYHISVHNVSFYQHNLACYTARFIKTFRVILNPTVNQLVEIFSFCEIFDLFLVLWNHHPGYNLMSVNLEAVKKEIADIMETLSKCSLGNLSKMSLASESDNTSDCNLKKDTSIDKLSDNLKEKESHEPRGSFTKGDIAPKNISILPSLKSIYEGDTANPAVSETDNFVSEVDFNELGELKQEKLQETRIQKTVLKGATDTFSLESNN